MSSDADAIFSLPKALLVALFLESILFGAFTVLFAISVWILIYPRQHRHRSKINTRLLGTGTLMFVLTIVHMAIDVQRAMEGFIAHGGTPTGTSTFFKQLNNPLFVAKLTIYNTQTLVGDAFVIYRLYVIYNRRTWIVILPIILLAGTAITAYGIPINVARARASETIFSKHFTPWITSFFALSLTTNVLATILLSGRIMWSNYRVKLYHTGTRLSVLETVVQSAALISLLATYVSRSNAQYVCLDTLQPIIGITFTLIIIRVGLVETASKQSKARGHRMSVGVGGPAPPLASESFQDHSGRPFPLRPLAVKVSVSRTYDGANFGVYEQKNAAATVNAAGLDIENGLGHGSKGFP